MSKVLSAVAWPYANGPRHIGHVAGFGVPSDVFSRYMRMAGHDVLMVSGTDEHGTPILVAADKEGVTPRELADRNNAMIVKDLHDLGLSYDLFTRTTTRNHYAVVQEMFTTVHRNGYMVERTTKGAISPSTGRTLPDRYIEGTCPICGYLEARGDQCDNCGNQLDATDLIEPRSKINGEVPEFVETQHFFLDLPALADALKTWLDEREATGLWRPNVIKFSQNILSDIRPRAMTRDIDWGIPVPGWEDQPTKRLYVWFDAVIGYLSASIEWARRLGEPDRWRDWWNDPDALSYYFWARTTSPSTPRSGPPSCWRTTDGATGGEPGVRRAEPAHRGGLLGVPDHGGPAVLVLARRVTYVRDVLERYQPDALRYFISVPALENQGQQLHLGRVRPAHQRRAGRGLGQPGEPAATMVAKSFGEIPPAGEPTAADQRALDAVEAAFAELGGLIERHRQKAALGEVMRTVAEVNKYVSDKAPWKLKGEDERARLGTVLHVVVQAVADCNVLLSPFLPHSAERRRPGARRHRRAAPMPEIRQVEDLDGGPAYPVLTGDYTGVPAWQRASVTGRRLVAKPPRRSPSSTRRWSTRSWRGSAGDAAPAGRGRPASAGRRRGRRPRLRPRRPGRHAQRRPGGGRPEPREDVDRVEDLDADGGAVPALRPRRRPAGAGVPAWWGRVRARRPRDPRRPGAAALANRTGSAVLLVDYRARPPEDPFPAAPDDVGTALAWLLVHALRARIDFGRIVAVGDSAGANPALVAALSQQRGQKLKAMYTL